MKKILILFLLITTITVPAWCENPTCKKQLDYATDEECRNALNGDGTSDDCANIAGCEYVEHTCQPCEMHTYSGYGMARCEPCDLYYEFTHAQGARSPNYCYKQCKDKEIYGGYLRRTTTDVHYDEDGDCVYITECTNTGTLCTSYHNEPAGTNEPEICASNKYEGECTNGTGIKIYDNTDNTTQTWHGPFCTSCNNSNDRENGYHLTEKITDTNNKLCNIPLYEKCTPNKHTCESDGLVPKDIGDFNGTVTGNAYWIANTEGKDEYNYENCTWTIGESSIVPNGTGSATCQWDTDKETWGAFTYTITTCKLGYYAGTDAATKGCTEVGKGYYSPINDTNRYKCPPGSTTDGKTSSAITECKIEGGTTQICDGDGKCFTLPNGATGTFNYTKQSTQN